MNNWYVVQTGPAKEFVAANNLASQNFNIYLPQLKRNITRFNCKQTAVKPLFPGYLFVFIDYLKDNWSKINYTRGVKKLITLGRNFLPVSRGFVDELKKKEIDGYICLSKFDNFKRGETCLIKNGIFFNKLCVIDKVYENNKIHIIFNFLGREIKYLVSRDDLEPKF